VWGKKAGTVRQSKLSTKSESAAAAHYVQHHRVKIQWKPEGKGFGREEKNVSAGCLAEGRASDTSAVGCLWGESLHGGPPTCQEGGLHGPGPCVGRVRRFSAKAGVERERRHMAVPVKKGQAL